jgi:hypothetical protein
MNFVKRSAASGIPLPTYQVACTAFLCIPLPEDFFSFNEAEQEKFLKTNAWEPLGQYSTGTLWELIDSHAYAIHRHFG